MIRPITTATATDASATARPASAASMIRLRGQRSNQGAGWQEPDQERGPLRGSYQAGLRR